MESLATHSASVYYPWLLHTGPGAVLADGIRLGLGNGSALPIGVSSGGALIYSPANYPTSIASQATMPRNVSIADAHGLLQPRLFSKLTGDVSNNTITPAAVGGFGVTLEVDSIYEFRMRLYVRTAATTTGVQIAITGPTSQITDVAYSVQHSTTATLGTGNVRRQHLNALATNFAATDAPVANATFAIEIEGFLVTDPATPPASDIGLQLASEIGGSNVTLKKGSWMSFARL